MNNVTNIENTKYQVSLIIDAITEMIKNSENEICTSKYYYHKKERQLFIIHLYAYKLLLNNDEYVETKYHKYLSNFKKNIPFDLSKITNIECSDPLNLLLIIKQKISKNELTYNFKKEHILFNDGTYIDSKWFLTFVSILLDNTKNDESKEIAICYCIPNKDISKCTCKNEREKFLSEIRFYNINIKRTSKTKDVKENNILIVKNAAINYLKHLKQYKHGKENKESYQIFYNLLKNECKKDGFKLTETDMNLLDIDEKFLNKITSYLDEDFYNLNLDKQVKLIEDIVWQSSNDITLLEHNNTSIDALIDLLTAIRLNKNDTYSKIRNDNQTNDIQILLILIINQFLLTYLNNIEEIDYSLLNLSNIKPKYMNSICRNKEEDLKNTIKGLNIELSAAKKTLDKYKQERSSINPETMSKEKYQTELELCVSKINSISITIARLNSNLSSISKEYDNLQKAQKAKYHDVDKYNYNHSIIRHICNSILGCSFYLKTSNTSAIFSNIIVFEDYEKTDNSFYLEVSFKELLKISSKYILNGLKEQNDLPKLA